MSAQDFDATRVPQDVVTVLGLAEGTLYQGQNTSTTATLRIREAAVAPDATVRSLRAEAGGVFVLKPDGDGIWLWTDETAGCPVIITPAP